MISDCKEKKTKKYSHVKEGQKPPPPMAVNAAHIPDEMKERAQWLTWQWTNKKKADGSFKWEKPPRNLRGEMVDGTNQANWAAFGKAIAASPNGIGFALGGSEIIGVDLDNCRNPDTGETEAWAQEIIDELDSYAEVSPSRTGYRILLKGKMDLSRWRKQVGDKEIYQDKRYLTVTGNVITDSKPIRLVGPEFSKFMNKHFNQQAKDASVANESNTLAEADTLAKVKEAIEFIDPDGEYETWLNVGMGLQPFGNAGFDVWNKWSSSGGKYVSKVDLESRWRGFTPDGGITVATIFHHAINAGYKPQNLFNVELGTPSGQTDLANAERFINEYGELVRYVSSWDKWMFYDEQLGKWLLERTPVERLVQSSAKKLWPKFGSEAKRLQDPRQVGRMMSFVKQSCSQKGMSATLRAAQADMRIGISHEDLDSHPTLLNCQNGLLDVATGSLSPHSPKMLITQQANVNFDANAGAIEWYITLDLVFNGDRELVDYFQEVAGYSLVGGNPSAILPIFYGKGNNGKSTCWLTLTGLMGDYAMSGNRELVLGTKNEHQTIVADLYKKRLVAVAEPDEGSPLKEAEVKRFTGSDIIRTRRMREDSWEFSPTHTLWISSNHRPKVTGTDDGIWRRLKLIPCTADLSKVTTPKPDFHLWLIENEGPGILNWAIKGYQRWAARGKFNEPEAVKISTAAYRDSEDVWKQWIESYCEIGTSYEVRAEILFEKYQRTGGKALLNDFRAAIKSRFDDYIPTGGVNRKKQTFKGLRIMRLDEPEQIQF